MSIGGRWSKRFARKNKANIKVAAWVKYNVVRLLLKLQSVAVMTTADIQVVGL